MLAVAAAPRLAVAASLRVEVARFTHPAFALHGLKLQVSETPGGAATLTIDRIAAGGREWRALRLGCRTFRIDSGRLRCGGTFDLPGAVERAAIDLRLDANTRSGALHLRVGERERVALVLRSDGRVELDVTALTLARLSAFVPALAEWQPKGRFDGRIAYSPAGRLTVDGALQDAGVATADGLRAAERVAATLALKATRARNAWDWDARLAWTGGEAYWHPFYLSAGAKLEAAGRFAGELLAVSRAELQIDGVRRIAANGEFDLGRRAVRRAALAVADADLAVVGPRFLAPALAAGSADRLRFAGRFSAGIEVADGALAAFDLAFDEAGFALPDKGLAFGPASGMLPWRRDASTRGQLEIAGGAWQKLALGAFALDLRFDGNGVAVDRVAIPLLDGALVVERLALRREPAGWVGQGAATVEPVSMVLLADAVGLPPMSGVLSASLPGLRVAPGEIALDGALVVSLFGGYLQATRLQLVEPFGVAARVEADVAARHIDLAQLTETYSFGRITGFVDADVSGLELAGWRPVRFDARIASSPGDYPRRISQRAVENISALGGPGAVAALQRGFLGLFQTFGYREIGLTCALRGGVCAMGGLGDARGGGFYLVRGGGVPAVNVIGYNRRVDWRELVDRLQRVVESNTAPVIR